MPLQRRAAPGGMKPDATPAETATQEDESASATPAPKTADYPWSSPSEVVDLQGLSMFLFSNPGIGKTTLGLSMLNSIDGGPLLVVNFDEELRSLSDLGPGSNVMVWPGVKQQGRIRNWAQIETFTAKLLKGGHPFKSIMFDTLNSAYDKFALPWIQEQDSAARDPRQTFGKANDLLLRLIQDFCGVAREQGLNVLFTGHAEEKQVGENGPIIARPKITPGVVLGLNQRVSIIGYLHPKIGATPRKLQLEPSPKATAKIHQPRTGPKVPGMIKDPDLGLLIDHLKHGKPYPKEKADAA